MIEKRRKGGEWPISDAEEVVEHGRLWYLRSVRIFLAFHFLGLSSPTSRLSYSVFFFSVLKDMEDSNQTEEKLSKKYENTTHT